MLPRSLGGVFCDDIRQEVSGKVSLIGCYTGGMYVNELPAVLPKLCAHVRLVTMASQPFRYIKFLIYRDDEIVLEGEMSNAENREQAQAQAPDLKDEWNGKIVTVTAQFVLSPLELPGPCTMKVRAIADGEELRGLALRVGLMPTANMVPMELSQSE